MNALLICLIWPDKVKQASVLSPVLCCCVGTLLCWWYQSLDPLQFEVLWRFSMVNLSNIMHLPTTASEWKETRRDCFNWIYTPQDTLRPLTLFFYTEDLKGKAATENQIMWGWSMSSHTLKWITAASFFKELFVWPGRTVQICTLETNECEFKIIHSLSMTFRKNVS